MDCALLILTKNFRQYTGSQYGTALLGQTYQVESKNGIPSIDPNATGTTTLDQIILTNSTSSPVTPVTMGFTLGGNIVVAEQNVGGGQKTIYRVHPTYYVACFHDVVLGELVDESVAIGPVQVSYAGGVHSKNCSGIQNCCWELYSAGKLYLLYCRYLRIKVNDESISMTFCNETTR